MYALYKSFIIIIINIIIYNLYMYNITLYNYNYIILSCQSNKYKRVWKVIMGSMSCLGGCVRQAVEGLCGGAGETVCGGAMWGCCVVGGAT